MLLCNPSITVENFVGVNCGLKTLKRERERKSEPYLACTYFFIPIYKESTLFQSLLRIVLV